MNAVQYRPLVCSSTAESPALTTDDLLPLLVYLVVKADVPNWWANLAFVKHCRFSRNSADDEFGCVRPSSPRLRRLCCPTKPGAVLLFPWVSEIAFFTARSFYIATLEAALEHVTTGELGKMDLDPANPQVRTGRRASGHNPQCRDYPSALRLAFWGSETKEYSRLPAAFVHFAASSGLADIAAVLGTRKRNFALVPTRLDRI